MYEENNERLNGDPTDTPDTPTPQTPQDSDDIEIDLTDPEIWNDTTQQTVSAPQAAHQTPSADPAQNIYSGEYSGAGVGQTYYAGADQRTAQPSYGSYYSAPEPPKNNKNKKKKKSRPGFAFTALICVMCILLGAASGFGGAYAYRYFFDDTEASENKSANSSGGDVVINQSTNTPAAEPEEGSLTGVIESISQTVVEIRTEQVSYGYFIGNYVSEGAGSGVIISEDGYIITNNHVVEGADTLTVRTKSGDEYEATLVGTDAQTDIAVIKIDTTGLPAAEVGTSNDLLVGQRAIAIGNPLGELGGTVTIGYISALDREVNIDGVDMTLLQTDAAINPGNSGGGLFDTNGRLIGIVNAKSSGDDIEGLGFAIPIDTAIAIATDLIEVGHVSGRPGLGIQASEVNASNYSQFRSTELEEFITDYGVYVVSDERNNFEFGDRIVAFNDITISTQTDLSTAIGECSIGDTVTVMVSRNRKLVKVEVELIELNG